MRVLLHETVTGEFLREVPFSSVSWSTGICQPDTLSVAIPAYTEDIRGLVNMIIPRKVSVSFEDDFGVVRAAGVLSGEPEYDDNENGLNTISLQARGVESLYERRYVLPYPYGSLVDAEGYPDPRWDTNIEWVDYGTMIKKLYQQAMSHPGGELPCVLQADRTGTRQKNWTAVDGKSVQSAVEDISELIGGVEWDWVPVVNDSDNLVFHLVTANDNDREITSEYWHTWSLGGSRPDIRRWKSKVSPEFMTSSVFFTGGKDEDRVMVSQQYDSTLIDAGFPLSETWDSSHSSVSEQPTLDGWATSALQEGQAPTEYWTFEVRSDSAVSLRHGDWCTIEAKDHWKLLDGSHTRRVVQVSGTADSRWMSVVVAGETSW